MSVNNYLIKQQRLMVLHKALYLIHNPRNNDVIKNALYRLKFDEHFFLQLLMALNKKKMDWYENWIVSAREKFYVEILGD